MRCIKSNGQFVGLAFFLLVGSGCYHPVTTMFETSESLEAGETKVTLAGTVSPDNRDSNGGVSFTGIVDHGISANQDIRFRVERRNERGTSRPDNYSFLEFGSKWSGFATAKNVAVALPIQAYIPDDGDAFLIVDPRVILSTKNAEETLEVSSVFHTQLGVWDGYLGVVPGITLGFGFGKDNAVRFDVGWSLEEQITFGFGVQFMKEKDQDPQLQ